MADSSRKKIRLNLRLATGLFAILIIGLSLVAIAATGLFIFGALGDISGEHFTLSDSDRRPVETIDLARLNSLQERIADKNKLDAPREGRLHNPFLEPVIPPPTETPTDEGDINI
ncbi:hypothetical protein COY93_04185 [Candidatus Uhrbacteria bacterium CG_4_10_14_0_8_um_filter_58_22]|uniref:Uncharacterized protein n=1 Tax=Candidatus Uhrbacteria bacterium CG_4_10_14_0_8_um_filter_58_22 TaxID=1975029 RepID=A0A2M7Q9V0_9BACT|nr:MAG: hypothetical protein AUJ19_04775 [Parcubacteria group bacterium CG1_02_58_44]PIY62038.1 MAG: hypothetical protein COY93_04185 [Candidatus Uhrbacteria bacterium CG_4_10_14_0_8_um_filter_58_22]